jgi:hypothetical protein
MTQAEIIEELETLSLSERLAVMDAVWQLIRRDLGQVAQGTTAQADLDLRLAAAAAALREDYLPGGELTVFTALDAEDFYEYEAG